MEQKNLISPPCSKNISAQELPKGEEIARLWMNENNVVNQKSAYFTAVNGVLSVAFFNTHGLLPAAMLICIAGVIVSIIAFASISRTCAYRRHLRAKLECSPGYGELLTNITFRRHERISSNDLLFFSPLLSATAWVVAAVLRLSFPNLW